MITLEFNVEKPLQYCLTGKFEAPSANWKHEDFPRSDYELFVVTDDVLYVNYNNVNYSVKNGQFLLIPPLPAPSNHIKGFRSSNCSFYWMHFDSEQQLNMNEVPDNGDDSYPYLLKKNHIALPMTSDIPTPEKIVVLMRQLQDAVKANFNTTTLNYMTTTILCELHSQFYDLNAMTPIKKTQKQMYYDIIDFVKLNAHKNLKVADIAKHFGYNEKYLSHMFSSISGIPLKHFILTTKMDMANFLLTDTNKSVLDIALSLGFSDGHNFARAYKKICGLTPSEYRNAFSKRLLYHK